MAIETEVKTVAITQLNMGAVTVIYYHGNDTASIRSSPDATHQASPSQLKSLANDLLQVAAIMEGNQK